jgi:hypothetical protein
MVDDPRKEFDDLLKKKKELTDQMSALANAGKEGGEVYKKLALIFNDVEEKLTKLTTKSEELKKELTNEELKAVPNLWNEIKKGVSGLGGAFDGVIKNFVGFGSQLSNNKDLAVMFNDKTRQMIDVSKEFSLLSTAPAFGAINQSIKSLLPSQTLAREAFTSFGDSIEVANLKASEYPQTLIHMSAAFGVTTAELGQFNASVKAVPGALDNVKGSILGITSLNGTFVQTGAALLTTLRGIGLSSTESAGFVKNAFENFGRSAGQITKIIGEMSEASRGSGLSSKFVSDSILTASSGLGIFGEKAGLATNVWKTFTDELKNSGVAVNSINSIVSEVVNNISKMSTENKAFVGMMSGMMRGASAMGGALRMEMSMRGEGGLEKTIQMLTSTLSGFAGGRIINLEQAATNPQLENLFVLQRQTLGKLMNISDTEKQNRILEVLQSVQQGGVSQVQGSKALQEVFDKGKNIQERQVTSIERIEQILRSNLVGSSIEKITNFDQFLRGKGAENLSRASIVGGVEQQTLLKSGIRDLTSQLGNFTNQSQNFNARMSLSDNARRSNLQAVLTANRDVSTPTEEVPMESAKTPSYMMGGANLLTSAKTPSYMMGGSNLLTSAKTPSNIVNWSRPQQDIGAIQEGLPQAKKGFSISSSESSININFKNDSDYYNELTKKVFIKLKEMLPSLIMGIHNSGISE